MGKVNFAAFEAFVFFLVFFLKEDGGLVQKYFYSRQIPVLLRDR